MNKNLRKYFCSISLIGIFPNITRRTFCRERCIDIIIQIDIEHIEKQDVEGAERTNNAGKLVFSGVPTCVCMEYYNTNIPDYTFSHATY